MEEQNTEALKLREYWKQVMEEYTSDSSKLHEYLKQNMVDFPAGDGELQIFKFRAGTSNPTFLLRKNGKEFVLRHKSPVQVYIGYHKVDVEYKIMSALGETSFPVPKTYLYCEDKTIMGQEFYVMEYIKGRQFPDANLPGVPPEERKAIFEVAIKTLAQLQSVDTDKLHLDCIGNKENFFQQRLDVLYEGYKRTEIKAIPKVDQLTKWLKENIPKDDKKPVIHHTDFRIPNMLFHPEESQILAVIDWEAASWGHPFEDLAYFCLSYHYPEELDIMPGFKVAYYSEGIPSEEALLSLYCELTGYSLPLPNWTYFLALVFFRVVVNIQTVFAQLTAGGVELPFSFKGVDDLLEPLVQHACNLVGLKVTLERDEIALSNDVNVRKVKFAILSDMEEQNSDAAKLQEYWKQSMVECTSDSSTLHEYLKQNLVDFPTGDEELKMFKFRAGTSNPTFLLRKNGKEFVLRHKSPVEVHIGYHKVDVEYKIMSALGKTSFPVPKMYLFCEDKTIMGQEFYVMEYIKGRQFPDANLPGVPPDQRKAIFEIAIKKLVHLQTIDTDRLDLDGIGDKENFFHQRLDMLYEGYKRSEIKEIPKAHQLMKWLKENIPRDDKKPVIHHTEFRISNMLFHPEQCQVLAVIDWEAASWGHPFEDLAYFCFPHHFPPELDIFPAFKIGYCSEGIPSEEALLSLYCELTGYSLPLQNWTYFLALVFFRLIVNIQTGIAPLRSGDLELPVSLDGIVTLLEPVVEHACTIVGLK